METTVERRKRGPVPSGNVKTSISIDAELLEWGKRQPGGLSEIVRKLLREAKDKQEPPRHA